MKKICLLILLAAVLAACGSAPETQKAPLPRKAVVHPASGNSPRMVPATGKGPCYEIGYQWGVCTIKNTADGSCDPKKDIRIPDKCNDRPETQQGIKDGLRDTQLRLQQSF